LNNTTNIFGAVILIILGALSITGCETENSPYVDANLTDTKVYDTRGAYHDVLKECAITIDAKSSCSLNKLPLLMQQNEHPTKEQIMQRVLVSHDWMGQRFAEMLDLLDSDIRTLLRATTAIVIDNDIHPSYYWKMTGAMYIDPRYLWLTPEEAQTITPKKDYRNDYDRDLKFNNLWVYIKDGRRAYHFPSINSHITRTKEDIKYALARLLYHELGHANDYSTKEIIASANKSLSISKALYLAKDKRVSSKLYTTHPLTSSTLKGLGQVMYHGEEATETQKAITASEVGTLFDEDGAVDIYGYSNQYEDLAMLFEESMMKLHYGLDVDLAFYDKKASNEKTTCDDLIVRWGKRNRLADPQVSERAKYVTLAILPDATDWDDFFSSRVGVSIPMEVGVSWCDSHVEDKGKSLGGWKHNRVTGERQINLMDFRIPEL